MLRDYLETKAEERAKGITLETIYEGLQTLANRQLQTEARVDRFGRRLTDAERELARLSALNEGPDWRPDAREITGSFQIKELTERIKEEDRIRRENSIWWKRQGWIWAFGIATLILGAMLGGCINFALQHLK